MANNSQSVPYPGYPGDGASAIRVEWRGDHFGPGPTQGNYQQGGYNLNAAGLGMSTIEAAWFSQRSQSGNYFAYSLYPANSNIAELQATPQNHVTVKWYYAANSVEVANNTNLNAEAMFLEVIGLG
jgi:hypothetical protein